jgi:hypothetical protein
MRIAPLGGFVGIRTRGFLLLASVRLRVRRLCRIAK